MEPKGRIKLEVVVDGGDVEEHVEGSVVSMLVGGMGCRRMIVKSW